MRDTEETAGPTGPGDDAVPSDPAADPALRPAPTAPVHPGPFLDMGDAATTGDAPVARRAGGRVRVLAVLGVVAVLAIGVAIVVGAGLLARTPTQVGWLPGQPAAVAEVVLRPSAGQAAAAAANLAKFPSLKDETFDTLVDRLDEALAASPVRIRDIRPWVGDVATFAVYPGDATAASAGVPMPRVLAIVAVSDAAAAAAWVGDNTFGPTEDHGGVTLVRLFRGDPWAAVASGRLFLGDHDSIVAALDTNGAGAFAGDAHYAAALAAIPADRLGHLFLDGDGLRDMLDAAGTLATTGVAVEQLPAWTVVSFRATTDGFEVASAAPRAADAPLAHADRLLARVPADTSVLAEIQSLGTFLAQGIDQLGSSPDTTGVLDELRRLFGDASWIGDAAVFVAGTHESPAAGAIVEVDAAKASAWIAANLGQPEDAGEIGGVPAQTLFGSVTYVITDGRLVLGTDRATVERLLGVTEAGSISGSATFRAAVATTTATTVMYVDVGRLIALLGGDILDPEAIGDIGAVESMALWGTTDGDLARSTVVLRMK